MEHLDSAGVYLGPERRMEYRNKRKQVLTEDDVLSFVSKMKEEGLVHACRYDITPEDMRDLMAFVRTFRDASIETRKTFQTMVIRLLVWGFIAGAIGLLASRFGWFRAVARILTIPVPP
jgi:hypothetical protein